MQKQRDNERERETKIKHIHFIHQSFLSFHSASAFLKTLSEYIIGVYSKSELFAIFLFYMFSELLVRQITHT